MEGTLLQAVTACIQVGKGKVWQYPKSVTLQEFETFYRNLQEQLNRTGGRIHSIDIASTDSGASVIIAIDGLTLIYIRTKTDLSEKDFEYLPEKRWHGPRRPITIRQILWREIKGNWIILTILIVFFALLEYRGLATFNVAALSEILVGAVALFVSIFVLFVASQNNSLNDNFELYDDGTLDRMYKNDKFVLLVALLSLLSAIYAALVAEVGLLGFSSRVAIYFSIILLVLTLRSVGSYYLRISKQQMEGHMIATLIAKISQKQEDK